MKYPISLRVNLRVCLRRIKMNTNVKLWLEALRSGDYNQGQRALKSENDDGTVNHCCLGVACEVYMEAGNTVIIDKEDDLILFNGNKIFLPEEVKRWLGLKYRDGSTSTIGVSLTSMNDNGGSFLKIADFIESNPLGLFLGE